MNKDIFSEENEMKSAWVSWGKVGDSIVGTLIAKYQKEQTFDGKTSMQWIYEIKASGGAFHQLERDDNSNWVPVKEPTKVNPDETWNIGGKAGIDAQMRNVKLGQIVGLKYTESIPNKDKTKYPTKKIQVYTNGEMDEAWIEENKALDPDNF
jgi:hypothetical protein